MYRNAVYWFLLLLLILLAGFWPSYFSRLGDAELHHHLHSIPMLAWALLLVVQAWLMRSGRRPAHRTLGRLSLLLAPLVFLAGIHVVGVDIAERQQPWGPFDVGIFWFGLFLAFVFVFFYAQAIIHRRNMQLHQRWMAATALVFLIPGLGRLLFRIGATFEIWVPNFLQTQWIPVIITTVLIIREWRAGRVYRVWPIVTVLWLVNIAMFTWGWKLQALHDFALWMATLWGGPAGSTA